MAWSTLHCYCFPEWVDRFPASDLCCDERFNYSGVRGTPTDGSRVADVRGLFERRDELIEMLLGCWGWGLVGSPWVSGIEPSLAHRVF